MTFHSVLATFDHKGHTSAQLETNGDKLNSEETEACVCRSVQSTVHLFIRSALSSALRWLHTSTTPGSGTMSQDKDLEEHTLTHLHPAVIVCRLFTGCVDGGRLFSSSCLNSSVIYVQVEQRKLTIPNSAHPD